MAPLLARLGLGRSGFGFSKKSGGAAAAPAGITATGGVISDYTSGPAVQRAHIFTSTGTFTVTAPGGYGDTVEYLVVAGGGGGGQGQSHGAAGGGAGGYRTNVTGDSPGGPGTSTETAFPVSTSPGSYTITIGGGGVGLEKVQFERWFAKASRSIKDSKKWIWDKQT